MTLSLPSDLVARAKAQGYSLTQSDRAPWYGQCRLFKNVAKFPLLKFERQAEFFSPSVDSII